jgi:hypothetical protein
MKNSTKSLLRPLLLVTLMMLTACSTGSGLLRDMRSSVEHQLKMDVTEVMYLRTVSVTNEKFYILGLFPTNGDGLYDKGMELLQAKAQLKTNQFLENLREDDDIYWNWFYYSKRITISADIYEIGTATRHIVVDKKRVVPKSAEPEVKPEPKPEPKPEVKTETPTDVKDAAKKEITDKRDEHKGQRWSLFEGWVDKRLGD